MKNQSKSLIRRCLMLMTACAFAAAVVGGLPVRALAVIPTNPNTTVYISTGSSATKYHLDQNCNGLQRASRVVSTTLREAQTSGKTLCAFCEQRHSGGGSASGGGTTPDGWQQSGDKWWYMTDDGWLANGWYCLGGSWYYFDASGWMVTGWLQLNGTWYYLSGSGAMVTGWQYINGNWYYFASSGAMQTGWLYLGGYWYWLDSSGAMATGWAQVGGVWYLFDGSGHMLNGWQKVNGTWYYLNGSGAMQTGWLKLDGKWYYLRSSGAMAVGWRSVGGYWYWFDPQSGAMGTGWLDTSVNGEGARLEYLAYTFDYDNDDYYLNDATAARLNGVPEGSMAVGWACTPDPELGNYKAWCYFESDGRLHQGWVKTGGKWYYMPPESGRYLFARVDTNGDQYLIDGHYYSFDENGAMQTGWVYQNPDYDRPSWYYYDKSSGALLTNAWTPDGYWVDANGRWDGNPSYTLAS